MQIVAHGISCTDTTHKRQSISETKVQCRTGPCVLARTIDRLPLCLPACLSDFSYGFSLVITLQKHQSTEQDAILIKYSSLIDRTLNPIIFLYIFQHLPSLKEVCESLSCVLYHLILDWKKQIKLFFIIESTKDKIF